MAYTRKRLRKKYPLNFLVDEEEHTMYKLLKENKCNVSSMMREKLHEEFLNFMSNGGSKYVFEKHKT